MSRPMNRPMSRLHLSPAQRLPALLALAVAGWALIFAVAAFTGLGGRYRLHPEDAARAPELPELELAAASAALQEAEAYASVGQRPLFSLDRLPPPLPDASPPSPSEPEPQPVQPLEVDVTSIILTPQLKLAIVINKRNGRSQSLKPGQALDGNLSDWSLKELHPRHAVFDGPGGETSVDLRVFNGSGGDPPSAAGVRIVSRASQSDSAENNGAGAGTAAAEPQESKGMTPEQRAELIRQRIAERRRQMREEAARANNK